MELNGSHRREFFSAPPLRRFSRRSPWQSGQQGIIDFLAFSGLNEGSFAGRAEGLAGGSGQSICPFLHLFGRQFSATQQIRLVDKFIQEVRKILGPPSALQVASQRHEACLAGGGPSHEAMATRKLSAIGRDSATIPGVAMNPLGIPFRMVYGVIPNHSLRTSKEKQTRL